MITKSQRKSIKKIIGNHYVLSIQKELNLLGARNKHGLEYSSSQITNVMNGKSHALLESVVFSLVQKKLKAKEERNAILNGSTKRTRVN